MPVARPTPNPRCPVKAETATEANAKNAQPTGVKQDDENEPTRVHLKTPEELIQLIEGGEFEVADSLVAALFALRKLGL